MFHQGKSRCNNNDGLLTYVHCNVSTTVSKQFRRSLLWEGQLIDIKGESLTTPITTYIDPKDNSNNATIENFIGELTPVITDLGKGYNTALVVGDFKTNPLQLNEREKYNDFLELMCTNSFYPEITLPTRFANKSCSLINQVYCKSALPISAFPSKIVISQLSDHFPCIVSFKLLREKKHKPKYVSIHACTLSIINDFKDELKSEIPKLLLNNNIMTDPNLSYQAFEDIQIKYGLQYCVTCPIMSTDPGSLNPGTRRSRVPGWWDPGIRTNTGAGDTVLAKHTKSVL